MQYNFDFTNKSVLITGAASGIGLESTKAFLSCGADVYMADYNEKSLFEIAQELKDTFPESKIFAFKCDITSADDRAALVDFIKSNTAKLDILVNNAGISHSAYSIKEKEEDWSRVLSINLSSQFFMAQLMANEFMIPVKKGKIVNTASLGGILGIPSAAAYSASKGGVIQFTKSLAGEWARFSINVNAVCPGFVETPLIADNLADERWVSYMQMRTPMRRLAKPDDVAGSILFLASDMAKFITGTSIVIDGGFSAN